MAAEDGVKKLSQSVRGADGRLALPTLELAMNATAAHANPVPAWCYTSLWQAWMLGLLLFALFPALRAGSSWLGAGSFWLVLAPLASLSVLYRRALIAVGAAILRP